MRGKRCDGLAGTCLENGQSREKVPVAVAPFDYFPPDGRFAKQTFLASPTIAVMILD